MRERRLDGCYFRVCRKGQMRNVCFSDLYPEEREIICADREAEWYKRLAYHLADNLRELGDRLDVYYADPNE